MPSHRKHRGRNKRGDNAPSSSATNARLSSPPRACASQTIPSAQSKVPSKTRLHCPKTTLRSDCRSPSVTLTPPNKMTSYRTERRSRLDEVFSYTLTMSPDPDCDPPPNMQHRARENVEAPLLTPEMLEYVYALRRTERFCTQPAQIRRNMHDYDVFDRYLYGADPKQVIEKWSRRPRRKLPKLLPPTNPYWCPLSNRPIYSNHNPHREPRTPKQSITQNNDSPKAIKKRKNSKRK